MIIQSKRRNWPNDYSPTASSDNQMPSDPEQMKFRAPYFPFYVNDFAADAKVEAMAASEVGAYVLLLCKAWKETPPGTLPDDDKTLARWARLSDEKWMEHKQYVMAPFTLKDGKYHQKRMKEEFRKMAARKKERSESGKKGATKKWGKDPVNKGENEHSKDDSSANGSAIVLLKQKDSISDQIRSDHTPIVPSGDLFGEDGQSRKWNPTPQMIRLGGLLKRKPKTVWSKNEIKAFRALGKIEDSDLSLLEAYYGDKIPPASDWRRKDLLTILNNFTGEVDRARNHRPHKPF